MSLVDLLAPPALARRYEVAAKVKASDDITLPAIEGWNDQPCKLHKDEGLVRTCNKCGVRYHKHQRKGIAWGYFIERGLLADSVGTGKTAQILGIIGMRRMRGEINSRARVVIVCRPQALIQWAEQFHRMLPLVPVIMGTGTVKERTAKYVSPWEVCIIGYQMMNNDLERLQHCSVRHVFVDDVDALRNYENKTAYTIKKMCEPAHSVLIATGTPLQKRLHELYSALEPLGGRDIFGSRHAFLRRYVRTEKVIFWNNRGRKITTDKVVGYKNLDEFVRLIEPLALRRTATDIDDVDLPAIIPSNIFLELATPERTRYTSLRQETAKLKREFGAKVSRMSAIGKLHDGARICAAPKLDWLMDMLDEGDLSDDKVVCFINYKDTIRELQTRLDAARIKYVTIWGDQPDQAVRHRDVQRFWNDPECNVLLGTTAIEQSLNLQCARHLVNVDQILNPSRMEQLAGRIRRDGSAFEHVYVHNLLVAETQEAKYMPLLEREQALIDHVWGEDSELFESLSPLALLELISP